MLLLTTTSTVLRLTTDSSAAVDVHASWLDVDGTTVTPGSTNTAISSSTTTTVVAAPSGTAKRNCKLVIVRNRHATTSVTVTTEVYNGSTAYQIDNRVLGPGQSFVIQDGVFVQVPTGGVQTRPWFGLVAGCLGDGNPGHLMSEVQQAGVVAATPTNITASVARCCSFILPYDLTFNRIRCYGVGATTTIYRVAIYRMSDLARLTAELAFTTVANTWVSIGSALNVTLAKDVCYFAAFAVNTTGTTPGPQCFGGTTTATTGQVQSTPAALPGNLSMGANNRLSSYQFQFAVTTGALPNPAATLALPAAWTGGCPAAWLDASDT